MDKIEQTYGLNCEKCGQEYQSKEAFPVPQLCPQCFQPIEGIEECFEEFIENFVEMSANFYLIDCGETRRIFYELWHREKKAVIAKLSEFIRQRERE